MARRKPAPIHPGEILLEEFLTPLGISQYRLAKDISVPPRRINEIVRGQRSITADTALRLARFFKRRTDSGSTCRYGTTWSYKRIDLGIGWIAKSRRWQCKTDRPSMSPPLRATSSCQKGTISPAIRGITPSEIQPGLPEAEPKTVRTRAGAGDETLDLWLATLNLKTS